MDPFAAAKGSPPRTLWAFYLWCTSGSGYVIITCFLASALLGGLEMAGPWILGLLIDRAMTTKPETFWPENWQLCLLCLAFFVMVKPLLIWINAVFQNYLLGPFISVLAHSRLHRWTMGHSIKFFEADFAGRIAQKEMQTAASITSVTVDFIQSIVYVSAIVVALMAYLFNTSYLLNLIMLAWVGVYIIFLHKFIPKVRKTSKQRANARSDVSGHIVDTVSNIKTVKLFSNFEHEDIAALQSMEQYRQRYLDWSEVSVKFRFFLTLIAGLLPISLLGASLGLWATGNTALTLGKITTLGAISLRLSQTANWISFTIMSLYANLGIIEDGMRTLTPPYALKDAQGAKELEVDKAEVEFNKLTFAYGHKAGGIRNISLKLHSGEKLGIVGASGAGKSTLVSLLLRLHDPESGSVTIDNQNIGLVTQDSLRRHIGMVTQETSMFNRSARDNILYGRPKASESEMLAAAKKAEAHLFIEGITDSKGRRGYDAHLGERGVKLSGGQRQRIALARAILKDAPILVLDEATSSLDSEVEASIQTALEHVMEGKTVLAIAHRLSTLASMDRIIVMDEGEIVEDGTHRTLLSQDGLYARYWNRQSGGFIGIQEAAE